MKNGQVACLVDVKAVRLGHAGVVLDEPIRHDDVANEDLRIEAARHAREDHRLRLCADDEHRRQCGHGYLADAGLGQHHGMTVERPHPGGEAALERERLQFRGRLAQRGQLLRKGGDDGQWMIGHAEDTSTKAASQARSRATHISSAGHCHAHSGVT